MSGIIRTLALAALIALAWLRPAAAQDLSGLARVLPALSGVTDAGEGLSVDLGLTQGVPYRVYTLEGPARLVLDFREVDWTGITPQVLLNADGATALRFGGFRPGWSRMVVDLATPMAIRSAVMKTDESSGQARLQVRLAPVGTEEFADLSGPPADPNWGVPGTAAPPPPRRDDGVLRVMLDPGHGGIDPGAERDGMIEKHLMLSFALELQELLLRSEGFDVMLTRRDDSFVSLERRVALAHQAGADVFISLHADALAEGHAHGATVHTLSDQASDAASARLAERHDRADMLAGVDLTDQDDVVANVLLDLARQDTTPRAEALAHAMVTAMDRAGGPMNRKPLRKAGYSVLKAADIPSILIELGFMSSPRDQKNLADAAWRAGMAVAIRDALLVWRSTDAAARELLRQ